MTAAEDFLRGLQTAGGWPDGDLPTPTDLHAPGGPVNAQLFGSISLDLNDGPVRAEYSRGFDGKPTARLIIGEGTQSIAISVTNASPDVMAELGEKVAELAAWVQRQQQLQSLPEVA